MQFLGSLLCIKHGEGRLAAYFITLFILLGTGIAIAKGSADALFLKRYGVEYLAYIYVGLSVVLALVCTLYAAYIDRLSSERFLKIILSILLVALGLSWLFLEVFEHTMIYPVYYVLFALTSELFLLHGAFYLGQNLDTLQSKRLMPVVMGGYQLGMIVGGVTLVFLVPAIGLNKAPLLWGLVTIAALALISWWHKHNGVSPFYFPKGRSRHNQIKVAVNEFLKGLEFTRKNSLLMNASFALVLLVITFYMLSYCAHVIYTRTFDTEQALAGFFGALLIATNAAAMLLQVFVSNRVIESIGVRKTKLIYALTTISSFVFLILHPGFLAALFSSVNREVVMPAFRNPARQLFYNVLPEYMKGRARAISVAVVIPFAMFICGGLILVMQQYEGITLIAWSGLVLSILYLWYCIRMGKGYVSTLIDSMREKLYLPHKLEPRYFDKSSRLRDELAIGLDSEDDDVSLSYARALVLSFPDDAVDLILKRIATAEIEFADQMIRLIDSKVSHNSTQQLRHYADAGDDHLKATLFAAIFRTSKADNSDMIRDALRNVSPRIRSVGARAALESNTNDLPDRGIHVWSDLMAGSDQDKRASIELIDLLKNISSDKQNGMIVSMRNVITQLVSVGDKTRRKHVYAQLYNWEWGLPEVVRRALMNDLKNPDPDLRTAAIKAVQVVSDGDKIMQAVWSGLDDGHWSVRRAALDVLKSIYEDPAAVFDSWVISSREGTPRALKTLLESAIESSVSQKALSRTIFLKTGYAAELLSAIRQLDAVNVKSPAMEVLHTALSERFHQTVDLILMALTPLVESGDITVIRAGLSCKDKRYQADAQEALQSLEDDSISSHLIHLVGHDYRKLVSAGIGRVFENTDEVLNWCVDETDYWLRGCARAAKAELASEA